MRVFHSIYWIASMAAMAVFAKETSYHQNLLSAICSSIEYDQTIIPKEEIYKLVDRLSSHRFIAEIGNDNLRVKFVNLQGCIEHVLGCAQASGEIDQLIGVIHTPTPATPLCIKPDGDGSDLLDASICNDSQKLLTVRSRSKILREYLEKGGKLYIVYPQGGFEKRSPGQQKIYTEMLENYPGYLVDLQLPLSSLAPDLVGATYLFCDANCEVSAFSIQSRQANDIQAQSEWAVWFGPIKDPTVAARVNQVFDALALVGGPDPRQEIKQR